MVPRPAVGRPGGPVPGQLCTGGRLMTPRPAHLSPAPSGPPGQWYWRVRRLDQSHHAARAHVSACPSRRRTLTLANQPFLNNFYFIFLSLFFKYLCPSPSYGTPGVRCASSSHFASHNVVQSERVSLSRRFVPLAAPSLVGEVPSRRRLTLNV